METLITISAILGFVLLIMLIGLIKKLPISKDKIKNFFYISNF